jgi:hypothetical protein
MTVGDDVGLAEVRALQTAGTPARVTFEPAKGDDAAVVVSVVGIEPHQGQQQFTGVVVEVDDRKITIKGDEGTKTFAMGIADEHEIEHLGEHRKEQEPITVFLASEAAEPTVVAYEDA